MPSWAALTAALALAAAASPPPPPPSQSLSVAARDVREASVGTREAAPVDAAVQTGVELPQALPLTAFDVWWARLAQTAADDAAVVAAGPARSAVLAASLPRLLALVPEVYADKVASDCMCAADGIPPMSLAACLHAHFLRAEGGAVAAQRGCAGVIVDLLTCLRASSYPCLEPSLPADSEPLDKDPSTPNILASSNTLASGSGTVTAVPLDYGARSGVFECVRRRLALFARFLGLAVDGAPALPEYAAQAFLALLVRSRAGVIPPLPCGAERVAVSSAGFLRCLDRALEAGGAVRSVERERLKALVASEAAWAGGGGGGGGGIGETERLDLERALELVVTAAVEINQASLMGRDIFGSHNR